MHSQFCLKGASRTFETRARALSSALWAEKEGKTERERSRREVNACFESQRGKIEGREKNENKIEREERIGGGDERREEGGRLILFSYSLYYSLFEPLKKSLNGKHTHTQRKRNTKKMCVCGGSCERVQPGLCGGKGRERLWKFPRGCQF